MAFTSSSWCFSYRPLALEGASREAGSTSPSVVTAVRTGVGTGVDTAVGTSAEGDGQQSSAPSVRAGGVIPKNGLAARRYALSGDRRALHDVL